MSEQSNVTEEAQRTGPNWFKKYHEQLEKTGKLQARIDELEKKLALCNANYDTLANGLCFQRIEELEKTSEGQKEEIDILRSMNGEKLERINKHEDHEATCTSWHEKKNMQIKSLQKQLSRAENLLCKLDNIIRDRDIRVFCVDEYFKQKAEAEG